MKTFSITIPREAVFQRVARQMEWEGTRGLHGDTQYSRVSLSESDTALLHSFFDEAAMNAIDICRPMLRSVSNTDEALTLAIALSEETDDSITATLQPTLMSMVVAKVLSQWQDIVMPEKSGRSESRHSAAETKFQASLYHHPAPVRPKAIRS